MPTSWFCKADIPNFHHWRKLWGRTQDLFAISYKSINEA